MGTFAEQRKRGREALEKLRRVYGDGFQIRKPIDAAGRKAEKKKKEAIEKKEGYDVLAQALLRKLVRENGEEDVTGDES